ncbi:hypothetical protein BX600DRAFT_435496 [Xylariales sp. PMI_506]|nr:hypothetical protein BX600DRAFT_435496 [Xylariales sp. PMI_506]
MLVNKAPALAICSSSNLPVFLWPFATPASPWSRNSTTLPYRSIRLAAKFSPLTARRSYATAQDSPDAAATSPHRWPSCAKPTPYQIFDQKFTAPYSKARFYELVKMYHPDRHRHVPGDTLTPEARLERYRLVVAANAILSDPGKRRAYDLYGAGWEGIRAMDNSHLRHAEHSWRTEPGNASMNATWEDWERWYGERGGSSEGPGGRKQHPIFMSNELFVVVLSAFIIVATMGQAKRASTTTMNVVEMRERKHEALSVDISRRRMEQSGLSREERVESFLRQREGWSFGAATASHQPPSPRDEASK